MSELLALIPETGFPRLVFDAVWQSTLIAGISTLLLRSAVRQPAARSWLAVLACVLCLIAPGISATVRMFGLGLLSSSPAIAEMYTELPANAGSPKFDSSVASDTVVTPMQSAARVELPVGTGDETYEVPALVPLELPEESSAATNQHSPVVRSSTFSLPSIWTLLGIGWSIVAFVFLVRLGRSAIVLWRICREAEECDDPILLKSSQTAACLLKLSHPPRVYVSRQATCPAVISWIHARLIVPPVKEVRSSDHWVSIFAHELAHVQRRDTWARLITELGIIAMPWQPLLWWLRREYQQASEEACDDWAVYTGADPFDYASCLTEWIPRQQPTLALGIAGWPQMVRRRIERLLEDRSPSRPTLTVLGVTGTTIVAVVVLLLVALTQQGQLLSAPRFSNHASAANSVLLTATEDVVGKPDRTDVAPASQQKQTEKPGSGNGFRLVKVFGEARLTHWNLSKVLGFGADDATVISVGQDRKLAYWNVSTGKRVTSLNLPPMVRGTWKKWPEAAKRRHARCEVLTQDGTKLIICMADGQIRVVDVASRSHRILEHIVELPHRIVISDDASTAAILRLNTETQNNIDLVDLRTGRLLRTISRPFDRTDDKAIADYWQGAALNSNGTKLATGRAQQVTVWDCKTGLEIWNVRAATESPATGLAGILSFSPDDKMLASGGSVRDAKTGQEMFQIRLNPRTEIAATRSVASVVSFDPTSSKLAMIYGGAVHVTELATKKSQWVASIETNPMPTTPSLQFNRKGTIVAVSSGNKVVLLNSETGQRLKNNSPNDRVTSIAVSPTKPELMLGHQSGRVELVDLQSMAVDGSRRFAAESRITC